MTQPSENDTAYLAALERENTELKKENNRLRAKVGEPRQADPEAYARAADKARARYADKPQFRNGSGTYVTYN